LKDVRGAGQVDGVALRGRFFTANELEEKQALAFARFDAVKRLLPEIDRLLEAGDARGAEKAAEGLGSDGSTFIAEWVLTLKARRQQTGNLAAAIAIARLETRLYPDSFSAFYLLADLLFQAGEKDHARQAATRSLELEPNDSMTANLMRKIEATEKPLRFGPAGSYSVQYTNGTTGERREARLELRGGQGGAWSGTIEEAEGGTHDLLSVLVGADRLWAVAPTPYGPLEFRIVVQGDALSGDWAAPFGRNGRLTGRKSL